MKKNVIRTGALSLALTLGAAVAMPSAAQSSQPAGFPATAVGQQATLAYLAPTPFNECDQINHKNFCYCTGACSHDG